MKTQEYVKKYQLDQDLNFSHKMFVSDLTMDFMTLLEVGKADQRIQGFENAVRAIRMKWDGIDKRVVGKMPEGLWKYFYAAVICKMREELFPELMVQRRADAEERKRQREERRKIDEELYGSPGGGFWDYFFYGAILKDLWDRVTKPISSFNELGLDIDDSKAADVKKAYRKLVMIHHPDKGGDNTKFQEITEEKNRCLIYLSKNENDNNRPQSNTHNTS